MPHDTLNVIDDTNEARRNHGRIPDTGDNYVLEGCALDYDASEGVLSVYGGAITVTHGENVWLVDVAPRLGADAINVPADSQLDVWYSIGENEVRVQSGAPTAPYLQIGSVDTAAGATDDTVNRTRDDAVGALDAEVSNITEPLQQVKTSVNPRAKYNSRGFQLFNFEDLSAWTVGGGTLNADTSDPYSGSQSAELGGADPAYIDYSFGSAQDFTGKAFSMAFKRETGDANNPYIKVQDSNGNGFRYRASYHYTDGEWERHDFAPVLEESNWTASALSDVTDIRIRVDNATNDTFTCDDLRVHEMGDPMAAFVFDDSWDSHYSEAYDYMEQYGFPGTVYTITGSVGDSGRLSLSQMEEMQAHGWEFGNHTVNHDPLTGMSLEDARAEIEEGKRWLLDNGFRSGARHFTPPGLQTDSQLLDLIAEYHETSTNTEKGGPIAREWSAPLSLHRCDGEGQAVADVQTQIDHAVTYGGVILLKFHDIGSNISVADFQTIVDYVADQEIPVGTVSDVVDRNVAVP